MTDQEIRLEVLKQARDQARLEGMQGSEEFIASRFKTYYDLVVETPKPVVRLGRPLGRKLDKSAS